MKLIIFVRDEDRDEHEVITYDELGLLEVPLLDVIMKGRAMTGSIVLPAAWYKLEKSPGMRRIDGTIKLTISIILASEDHDVIQKRLQSPEPSLLQTRSLGPGQLLQYTVKQEQQLLQSNEQQSDDASLRGGSPNRLSSNGSVISTASSRPGSATRRRAASKQEASKSRIGSMIRRPPSARGRPMDEISVLSEEREGAEDDELMVVPKEKENQLREQHNVSQGSAKNAISSSHRYDTRPPPETHDDLFSFAPEKVLAEDEDNVLLQSGPPMADQSFLHEMIRIGVESAGNVIDKLDLGDVAQDAALHVAKAAASKAKKWIDPAVSEVVASAKVQGGYVAKTLGERLAESVEFGNQPRQQLAATMPALRTVEDAIVDHLDYAKAGSSSGGGGSKALTMGATHPSWKKKPNVDVSKAGEEEKGHESYDELLNAGPVEGDQLINPEEDLTEEHHNIREDSQQPGESVVGSLSREIEHATSSRRNSRPVQEADQYSSSEVPDEALAAAAAGGGGIAAVRVIRSELQYQRDFIKKTLFAIAKSTDNGFQRVSTRLETLESEVHKQKTASMDPLLHLPGGGDEHLPGEDDRNVKKSRNNTRSNSRSKSKDKYEDDRGGYDDDRRSPSPKNKRPTSSSGNNKSSTSKGASGLKNHIKKTRQMTQQDNYVGSFGGSNQGKDLPVQFVFRGENGNIASTAMANPPPAPSDMFLQVPMGDQALPPGGPEGFNPRNSAVRGSTGYNYAFPSDSPAKNPLLNKDFHEVLENGSLEDVSNMLESCAAKPDQLSASTRNRLFDIISTLLMRGKKVERPMLWVTNLLTTPDLFYQMAPHTQNDVVSGLKHVADMQNNSGMLAMLLLKKIRTMES